jgi:hypothetical protein
MKIDPVIDFSPRHPMLTANASGDLASDGFNVGHHGL